MAVLPQARISRQPLAAIGLSLATGILLHHAIENSKLAIVAVTISIALLIFAIHIRERVAPIAIVSLLIAFLAAGYAMAFIEHRSVSANRVVRLFEDEVVRPNEPVEVTGQLDGDPESAPDGLYLNIRTEQICVRGAERSASGMVLLLAHLSDQSKSKEYEALQLHHGARVRVMT